MMRTALMVLLMALVGSQAKWTDPVPIMEMDHYLAIYVTDMYRDPVSGVNHVICSDRYLRIYYHLAVADNGTVLHKNDFFGLEFTFNGVIKGKGDGKSLFAALWGKPTGDFTVIFTESSDGGKTWTRLDNILKGKGTHKIMQDMIYVDQTGRIFIFFVAEDHTLRMVTRPAGSTVFSEEVVIVKDAFVEGLVVKAGFSKTKSGAGLIHVFYRNDANRLGYVVSANNGATWSVPKVVAGEQVMTIIGVTTADPEILHVAYTTLQEGPAKLVYSVDSGKSFSDVTKLSTNNAVGYTTHGFATCGGRTFGSLVVTVDPEGRGDDLAEFTLWDHSRNLRKIEKPHPFTDPRVYSATLGCNRGKDSKQFEVAGFVVREDHEASKTRVYFAKGYETID